MPIILRFLSDTLPIGRISISDVIEIQIQSQQHVTEKKILAINSPFDHDLQNSTHIFDDKLPK